MRERGERKNERWKVRGREREREREGGGERGEILKKVKGSGRKSVGFQILRS